MAKIDQSYIRQVFQHLMEIQDNQISNKLLPYVKPLPDIANNMLQPTFDLPQEENIAPNQFIVNYAQDLTLSSIATSSPLAIALSATSETSSYMATKDLNQVGAATIMLLPVLKSLIGGMISTMHDLYKTSKSEKIGGEKKEKILKETRTELKHIHHDIDNLYNKDHVKALSSQNIDLSFKYEELKVDFKRLKGQPENREYSINKLKVEINKLKKSLNKLKVDTSDSIDISKTKANRRPNSEINKNSSYKR